MLLEKDVFLSAFTNGTAVQTLIAAEGQGRIQTDMMVLDMPDILKCSDNQPRDHTCDQSGDLIIWHLHYCSKCWTLLNFHRSYTSKAEQQTQNSTQQHKMLLHSKQMRSETHKCKSYQTAIRSCRAVPCASESDGEEVPCALQTEVMDSWLNIITAIFTDEHHRFSEECWDNSVQTFSSFVVYTCIHTH